MDYEEVCFKRFAQGTKMTAYKDVNLPLIFLDKQNFTVNLLRQLEERERNLKAILERGISFSDNVDCRLLSFTSSATPDAENTVAHTLGKIPTGFIVYYLDKGAVVYDSGTAWTSSNIYLKVNTATVAVKIIIF